MIDRGMLLDRTEFCLELVDARGKRGLLIDGGRREEGRAKVLPIDPDSPRK